MVSQSDPSQDLRCYAARLSSLYEQIESWVIELEPDASFSRTAVELIEAASGPYQVDSLDVGRRAGPALRFVPRGMYLIGSEGRVEARSRLGSETLVWVAAGGPGIAFRITSGGKTLEKMTGRPLFPDVPEGWAWVDPARRGLIHLDREVFRDRVWRSIGQ